MKLSAFNECRQTITDEDIVGSRKYPEFWW